MNLEKKLILCLWACSTSWINIASAGGHSGYNDGKSLTNCEVLLPKANDRKMHVLLEMKSKGLWSGEITLNDELKDSEVDIDLFSKNADRLFGCISEIFGSGSRSSSSLSTKMTITSDPEGFDDEHNPAESNDRDLDRGRARTETLKRRDMRACLGGLELFGIEKIQVSWKYSVDNKILDKEVDLFDVPMSPKKEEQYRRIGLCVGSALGFNQEIKLIDHLIHFR